MADDGRQLNRSAYWRENLRILVILLSIWFGVSFGLGILLVEPLNTFRIGGFPLGFWFAQQGSIYVFILLVFVYARWMDRVDRRYHGD
jgi:putative solute:sodium symporter small subunit